MQKSAVIEYKHDGHLCEGFAVWDDAGTKRPGILVFPEWGGVSKLAAIGYCFGGMVVLEMARDGQNDLAGVVSFHGVLATPTPLRPDTCKGKILVLHGADDPVVPTS